MQNASYILLHSSTLYAFGYIIGNNLMSQIMVGTSGFFYKDWKGIFYPLGTGQDNFLEYYSRHFNAVELNFTYYRLPEEKYSWNLIKKSNKKIEFSIKAFRGITHDISQDSLGSITDLFLDGINPFVEEGLLGYTSSISPEFSLYSFQ